MVPLGNAIRIKERSMTITEKTARLALAFQTLATAYRVDGQDALADAYEQRARVLLGLPKSDRATGGGR